MKRFRGAEPPRSFRAHDRSVDRFLAHAGTLKLGKPFAARLPLRPQRAAQPPSDPIIEAFKLAALTEAEITGLTSQWRVAVGDHPLQRDAAIASRQAARPIPEPGNGRINGIAFITNRSIPNPKLASNYGRRLRFTLY